ncbi:MAG: hypothetical protein Q8N04_14080 [Nitrospira sp.]|nr:hypothetical protein [Nitrospira sp.]
MKSEKQSVSLVATSLLVLTLAACGGSGGGDGGGGTGPANTGLLVQGTTWAPNGSFAKATPESFFQKWFAWLSAGDVYAQAARQPLANARVIVFRINKDGSIQTSAGNPTGVIAESTTDGGGRYSFFLPVGVGFSTDVIIQASDTPAGAAPTPIGNPRSMNAPVTEPAVNINPYTEAGLREMLAHAQPLIGSLPSLYANQETSSFLSSLEAMASATGVTLQDTINNVRTANAPLIAAGLNLLDEPGEVDQSTIAGNYAMAGYFVEADNAGVIKRFTHGGTATFDAATGRFETTLQVQGGQTAESCSAACSRAFARSPYATGPFSIGGSYLYYPTRHELFLKSDSAQVEIVKVGTTENVMMFPQGFVAPIGGIPNGFTVAVRKGSGVTPSDLGPGANLFSLETSLNPSAPPATGTWGGPLEALTANGSLTFTPPTVTLTGTGDSMNQSVSCTPTATGCTITANVMQSIDNLGVPNLPFTVTSDGTFTITSGPDSIQGTVDRSKSLIMFPGNNADGAAITFASKQVGNLTAASLNGTYFAIITREIMDQGGRIRTVQHGGTVTMSNGTFSFADAGQLTGGPSLVERRETCPSTATCAIQIAASGNIPATFSGTYTVEPGARLRLTFATEFGEYIGAAAPDTSFIHGITSRNGVFVPGQTTFSERSMIVMLKQ